MSDPACTSPGIAHFLRAVPHHFPGASPHRATRTFGWPTRTSSLNSGCGACAGAAIADARRAASPPLAALAFHAAARRISSARRPADGRTGITACQHHCNGEVQVGRTSPDDPHLIPRIERKNVDTLVATCCCFLPLVTVPATFACQGFCRRCITYMTD